MMKKPNSNDPRLRDLPSDAGLSGDILRWAEATGASAKPPAQGPLLGFRDPTLERAYLRNEHRRNRKYYAVSTLIVMLLVSSFLWTDPWLLPADALPMFRIARVWLLIPVSVLLAINAVWIADPTLWIRQCAALLALFGRARAGAGNLGLGLFVARAIAINHGGNIHAEPLADAVGARFTVQLPSTASPGNPSISAPAFGSNLVEGGVDS